MRWTTHFTARCARRGRSLCPTFRTTRRWCVCQRRVRVNGPLVRGPGGVGGLAVLQAGAAVAGAGGGKTVGAAEQPAECDALCGSKGGGVGGFAGFGRGGDR